LFIAYFDFYVTQFLSCYCYTFAAAHGRIFTYRVFDLLTCHRRMY
jgi:hypothetical protein